MTIQAMLARVADDHYERWLIQKDRLDFGPFTMGDLMRQMLKGQFTGDDILLDQETGNRGRVRQHPELREFCVIAERHVEAERSARAEQEQQQQDKKRRARLIVVIVLGLAVIGGGAGVAAYYYLRKPTTLERIVYKEKANDPANLGKIEITWKQEPQDQAARRKKYAVKRPKKKGGPESDDVTYLGDASKEGGDALLTQAAVQRVMQNNFTKLTSCVYEERRRTPSLRQVNIDFGIRGSGMVSSVTVNGQSGGPFVGCILAKMQRITFPPFDGTLTRASFSMSLR